MLVYAIRKKGTNLYLPSRKAGVHRRRAGHSWDVPIEGGGKFGPRLFATAQSARCALRAWLQGCWVERKVQTGEYGGDIDYELCYVEPEIPRKKEEMEIVHFQLVENSQERL